MLQQEYAYKVDMKSAMMPPFMRLKKENQQTNSYQNTPFYCPSGHIDMTL
jgi:hypothetical protein